MTADHDDADDVFAVPAPLPIATRRLEPAGADGREVAFSRDGAIVMSSSYVGHSVAWDVADGTTLMQPPGGDVFGKLMGGGVPDVGDLGAMMAGLGDLFGADGADLGPTLTPEGAQRLGGRADATGLHDVDRALGLAKEPNESSYAAYSPDGRFWAFAEDDELRLQRADIGRPGKKLRGEIDVVSLGDAKAFSADGEILAAGIPAGCVSTWKTEWGDLIASARAHRGDVLAIAFSADRQFLASSAADRTLVLWRLPTLEPIAKLDGFGDAGVTSLAFATLSEPAGDRTVLIVSDIDTLRAFSVPDLAPIARITSTTPSQPGLGIGAIAVSPDGTTLALSRGGGWVDLAPTAALLASAETSEGDAVHGVEPRLVTEAEDRAAAEAAEVAVRLHLESQLGGPVRNAFAALKAKPPAKAVKVVFELDDQWTGHGLPFAWAAFDTKSREVKGLPELPEVGEVLPESMTADSEYRSASRPVEQVMFETLVEWLGEQWHAHGPASIDAFTHVHEDDDEHPL